MGLEEPKTRGCRVPQVGVKSVCVCACVGVCVQRCVRTSVQRSVCICVVKVYAHAVVDLVAVAVCRETANGRCSTVAVAVAFAVACCCPESPWPLPLHLGLEAVCDSQGAAQRPEFYDHVPSNQGNTKLFQDCVELNTTAQLRFSPWQLCFETQTTEMEAKP